MKWLKRIHIIDKFLLIFMLIFMLQSGFNLFINHIQTQESNTIDVIIRTSAAAIFGYFISANFVRRDSLGSVQPGKKADSQIQENSQENTNMIRSKIGFASSGEEGGLTDGFAECAETEERKEEAAAHMQIVITSVIGITSLCILLAYRNFFEMTAAGASTISQLRDFVSGCVGFLIGGTTSRGNKR